MAKSRGLFDEQFRLEKLSKKQDPLERLSAYIDFEFFRGPLEKSLQKNTDNSKGGRPAYDAVLMFKILILQRYYNVSDDAIEYAILDRLSFMRFLGLGIHDAVPDAKTIWLFRDTLTKLGMIDKLFSHLDKELDKSGIIVHKGKLIDAAIVEVPVQRNSREENEKLKEGTVPEDWSENKLKQKDIDAKWTRKNNQNFFGYKNHIKADTRTKLITGYKVTSANIGDNAVVDELLDEWEDGGQPLHGDAAYSSKELEGLYLEKGIISKVNQQGYRNKKITKSQQRENRRKSKIRCRVEHIFGFMENSMNGIFLKYRSLVRNAAGITMMNLTYNLFRLAQINKKLAK
jgi:transposase, IS5 family